jgi:hypothetical protein
MTPADTQDPINWLLDSDPAIRWQAMRDLTDASPAAITAERSRVSREGLGAQILASQQPDESWRKPDTPVWLSTLFTLQMLRATGIGPADPAVSSAIARAQTNLRWNDYPGFWDLRPADFGPPPPDSKFGCKPGGNPFFEGEEEPCINGGVLALGGYFRQPNQTLASRLLAEQLSDGGWNCEAPQSTRSSFHTTICVLEGLLEFESALGPAHPIASQVAAVRRRAHEYLLERTLFRRLSTGKIVDPEFLQLAFPPRYRYDVLRALDYFRAAGVPPEPRMDEAVQVITSRRLADGRWPLDRAYDEALPVTTGESAGEPSRWNTLRALRVLRWYRLTDAITGPNSLP